MRFHRAVALALVTVALGGCAAGGGAASVPATTPAAPAEVRPSASVAPSGPQSQSPGPTTDPDPGQATDVPSRVVVKALGIDLPVVSGDLQVPGNPRDYPLCDVAQYLTTYRYPGRPGTTTWIYGHARSGMFLPLLEESTRNAGEALLGERVDVYSTANLRYRYRIVGVHPHATDRSIARNVPPEGARLVLQTSEGPRGTVPKLQVSAELVQVTAAASSEAMPSATPVVCFIP